MNQSWTSTRGSKYRCTTRYQKPWSENEAFYLQNIYNLVESKMQDTLLSSPINDTKLKLQSTTLNVTVNVDIEPKLCSQWVRH